MRIDGCTLYLPRLRILTLHTLSHVYVILCPFYVTLSSFYVTLSPLYVILSYRTPITGSDVDGVRITTITHPCPDSGFSVYVYYPCPVPCSCRLYHRPKVLYSILYHAHAHFLISYHHSMLLALQCFYLPSSLKPMAHPPSPSYPTYIELASLPVVSCLVSPHAMLT